MRVSRGELWFGRGLLIVLMAITILPFISLFTTALHPSGSIPLGIEWPAEPRWDNFAKAFNQASMGTLLVSSATIVLGVVPIALLISTMAGFAIGHLRIPGYRLLLLLFIFGLTLPFEAVITPIYYIVRNLGILNTRLAIIVPLIGLYMPFAVFWMRAHFVEHAAGALRGRPRRRRRDVGPVLAGPCAARQACDRLARHPHVRLDLEPVHPRAHPRRRSQAADRRRRARAPSRVSGEPTSRC